MEAPAQNDNPTASSDAIDVSTMAMTDGSAALDMAQALMNSHGSEQAPGWISTMGAVIATVHRTARDDRTPPEVADDLCNVCAEGISLFANAHPRSITDCALIALALKMRLDEVRVDDSPEVDEIAVGLLRIAMFLGNQEPRAEMIEQLARFTASKEELAASRAPEPRPDPAP